MFFELGLKNLIHRSGVLSYITPRFYLLNKEDSSMREYFLKKTRILSLALCNPFESAVTENVISILRYGEPSTEIATFTHSATKGIFEKVYPVNVSYCLNNRLYEIVLNMNPRVISILDRMKTNSRLTLGDCITSKRGAEISKDVLRNTKSGHKVLIGKDVKKYSICWSDTYIDTSIKEYSRLMDYFTSPSIYLRRVDSSLTATISSEAYAFSKNVYGLKLIESSEVSELCILAIINSKAANFYYKKRFTMKKEDAFPEIQTYLFEQLPIPYPSYEEKGKIENIVKKLLYSDSEDTNLQKELDNIIFNLYGLSDPEIKLIESMS